MTFKNTIKKVVGGICESRLLRPCVRRSAFRSVNVTYYHFVGNPEAHYKAFYSGCTVSKFADDMERLSRVFEFAPLNVVLAEPLIRRNQKRPLLAVTFDDGLNLGCNGVMEILDRYRVSATTFVITSCIGNGRLMWRHMLSAIQNLVPDNVFLPHYNALASTFGLIRIRRGSDLMAAAKQWDMKRKDEWATLLWELCDLPSLRSYLAEKKPYFEWDDLRQWLVGGHSVGFHTHTHPYCSRLQARDVEDELVQPAINLKQTLGIEELCLSYPFGDRLQPALERNLFERGIFKAFFGIKGFGRKGNSSEKLERAGIEGPHIGWSVFASHVLRSIGVKQIQAER
jgi:peptidoglycan/xylan/chitin deacetylase (PgdA/CDA1 family)